MPRKTPLAFEPNNALTFSPEEIQATLTTLRQMMWRFQNLENQPSPFKRGERIEFDLLGGMFSSLAALLS